MEGEKSIWFKKVAEPFGWMGNMAPYPIEFEGKIWRTSEALFQAMRYEDVEIKELIRAEKSPMGAKMKAKKHKDKMVVVPMSVDDVENMKKCVRLKFDQHPKIKDLLMKTQGRLIIEDIGNRNGERHKFWGAKKVSDSVGDGVNTMGKILMELRDSFIQTSE